MTRICTLEVLPITAPLAIRCDVCDQLHPYVPPPPDPRGPIVLTGTGAMFKEDWDALPPVDESLALPGGLAGHAMATEILAADARESGEGRVQYHVHYHWIGKEVVVDHSPWVHLENAREEADFFNSNHDTVHEAYAVVVAHKKGS